MPSPSRSSSPNASRYTVEKCEVTNGYTVLKVSYPNCTNYEGKKILVFVGDVTVKIMNSTTLDPHFETGSDLVARFVPTE